jgi:hypothetical protein
MKKFTLASLAVASLLTVGAAAPAAAQTPEASPLTFNATVTSEYRYRGISQSRFKPAVQLGADYAFPNGFYVGTWASTIKWIKDGGGKADFELDVYGGYTTELYGAVTVGPFTAKYSHSTTNLFGFAGSKNSGYLDVTGSFDLGDGLMLTPHVGHQKVEGAGNGIYSYTDYALTLSKDFNGIVPSLSILGTDAPRGSYVAPNGKQLGRSGVVVSVKYNF